MIKLTKALLIVVPLSFASTPLQAETVYQQGKATQVLGTEIGAEVKTSTTPTQGVQSLVNINSLGTVLQALFALTSPPNTIDGVTYTEVYSFGKRIFSNSQYISSDGTQISMGLAPTQVRVPVVVYPVGPLIIQVDGGARFQANLSFQNSTVISFPIEFSEPGLQLSAVAAAAGFVEGYASLFLIRGGVGGQVDLIDARLDVNSRFSLQGGNTIVTVSAIAEFLKGRIYAFLDLGLFGWGFKRIVDKNLYNWNGFCYATADLKCPAE